MKPLYIVQVKDEDGEWVNRTKPAHGRKAASLLYDTYRVCQSARILRLDPRVVKEQLYGEDDSRGV